MQSNYKLLPIGAVIGEFQLLGISRYDPVTHWPIYSVLCSTCGSTVIVSHKGLRDGTARCPSSAHLAATVEQQRRQRERDRAIAASRARIEAELAAQERARQERARRRAEEQRQLADEWRRYAKHALFQWDVPLDKLVPLETWQKVRDEDRQRIMDRIEEEKQQQCEIET